ncbi:MAG: hypothetical protein KDB00_15205 [Planctomycetales bacterium]|nr:hypothetical protein [Planctomycetales bacterium]
MQKQTKLSHPLLIAGCAGMILVSTGCRSAMPKWNMFSWRSTPSAETLAGNGPSVTYPAPPGESATPDAIVSYAGGTAELPDRNAVASVNPDLPVTGFDPTADTVNRAAAQSNGFNLASGRTANAPTTGLASYAKPGSGIAAPTGNNSTIPAVPTGYKFGTKTSTATTSSGSRYTMPSSYPAPGVEVGGATPSTGYTLPTEAPTTGMSTLPSGTSNFGTPSGSTTGAAPSATGFALPESMMQTVNTSASGASNPKPFTPKLPSATASTDSMTMSVPSAGLSLPGSVSLGSTNQGTSSVGPSASQTTSANGQTPATAVSTGASTASFSTASASLAPRPYSGTPPGDASGYAPGSTAGASSYPTTSGFPSTGTDGSFYR